VFTDEDENKKNGVHAFFSGEKVQPTYMHQTPDVADVVRSPEGFRVLTLEGLVRMKLTSFRDRDRTHLRDLLDIGAITPKFGDNLPADLRDRFREIADHPEITDWNEMK
jgi:hypothetical protein